jgi:hypothetical protein
VGDIFVMAAERCNFEHFAANAHVNNLKATADNACAAKYAFYLLRFGTGGDIKIFRMAAQQQVANAAPNQISAKTGLFQLLDDFNGGGADIFARDIVLVARYYQRPTGSGSGLARGNEVEKTFQHSIDCAE